jgi:hypothetical protein
MRHYLLTSTLVASVSAAQTLTASGDITFTLTTPLPLTDLATSIDGSGVVTLGCTPCANPSNSQHFDFQGVQFPYEQAPSDPPSREGSANLLDTSKTMVNYTITQLQPGTRVYPRLFQAGCSCGNGAQISNLINVDKTSLAFTVNPFLEDPGFAWDATDSLKTYDGASLPKGTAMVLKPTCFGTPKGNEKLRVHLTGAGVDATQDFASTDLALQNGVPFTPTSTGTLTVTCSLEPYGAVSNSRTMTVVDATSGTGGGTQSGAGGGASNGGGAQQGGGCTQGPGVAAMLLAIAVLARRRRVAR